MSSPCLAPMVLTFIYVFPDGRFIPGFTRWLALGWIVVAFVPVPIPGSLYPWNWWLSPLYTVMRVLFYVSAVLALVYRYRRHSTPVQRQQIKWVVFGVTIVVAEVTVALFAVVVFPASFPAFTVTPDLHRVVSAIAFYTVPILLPISIGIALLRYRLWDVDALINKALVYGLLTGLLGACYAGLILGLDSLAGAVTGATNEPIVLVISTLAIAALFLPVRQRLQALIDRRFYRRKYDAEKTLAAFNATLRNEVDLDQVQAQLLAVVTETMQPAHVSLWLRHAPQPPAEPAHHLEPPARLHPAGG